MLKDKKVLVGIIILLLLITGYFIYMLITDSRRTTEEEKNDTTTEETQEEKKEETEEKNTEESQSKLPEGWVEQSSNTYGYTIGVPDKWYYRFFGQTKMIGMDPNPIPEASEYAGVITFSRDDRSYEVLTTELRNGLENVTENKVVVNETEWTEISGNLSNDDLMHPGKNYLHSVVSVDGNSYVLTYSYDTLDNGTLGVYKQVRETVSF